MQQHITTTMLDNFIKDLGKPIPNSGKHRKERQKRRKMARASRRANRARK